jgi:copper transport protein
VNVRALATVAVAATLLALPQSASAHAVLQDSSPSRGDQVPRAPAEVTLRFDEPVEIAFGAVRVYDAEGKRVDSGPTSHPGGRGESVAVGLRSGLDDGIYTATYRVISADSHPVSGGFTFTVGAGGAAPKSSVADLIDAGAAGPTTEIAFGAVRALCYLAIALLAGGLAFALAVWRRPPAQDSPGGAAAEGAATQARAATGEAFAARARALALVAAGMGVVTSALGIVLQGATAGATSFWSALDPDVVGDVLGTRFGTIWGLRLAAFALFGVVVALPFRRAGLVLMAALAVFLCLTPALSGHASTVDPGALLVPANFLHVSAMSTWVGGVAALLLVMPAATRRLEPADRTPLLAGTIARFSTLALFAVAALVASGVAQAIPELESLSDFTGTAFGRALLIKIALLALLLALGAWNRVRARPELARLAERREPPGATGVLLRRSLRTELALMVAVLSVTAALVSYAPPSTARGPFATDVDLGPARLELTVDPARPGANELHMYLFRRANGAQYDRVKELRVSASLPGKRIGPVALEADKAGPGHYVVRRADIAPAGDWRLTIDARVSRFDAYRAEVEVPVK